MCIPVIKSLSFSESMALNCELHSIFQPPPQLLKGPGWLEWAGVVCFPSPRSVRL